MLSVKTGAAALLICAFTTVYAGEHRHFFFDRTMRVDYFHTGTKGSETIGLDEVYEEPAWPGSRVNLVDTLNLGEYNVHVYDAGTSELIFSRGYSTIFNEWQSTEGAGAGVTRTFHETVRFPFPRAKVKVTISRRDKSMAFKELYSTVIDPDSPAMVNRERRLARFSVVPIRKSGEPDRKVDILILGDGYRKEDMAKFRKDARQLNDALFSTTPFKERKNDFNVWAIEVVSEDSGIDKPDRNIWKVNALGTSYNTFGTPRYVLTERNRQVRDIAATAPYDFINILVNDDRYGGGGIYNLYTTCYTITDAPGMEWQIEYTYVHEFGHSFGGLGDEYYSSQVAIADVYQKGVEPWDPNVTALLDSSRVKWGNFVAEGTPLPTPWEKAQYDSLEAERAKLDRLAPDYYRKREPLYQAERRILRTSAHAGKIGAFEGAGYASHGLYRPAIDCRMFSLSLVDFDPVCRAALERMIDFYSH